MSGAIDMSPHLSFEPRSLAVNTPDAHKVLHHDGTYGTSRTAHGVQRANCCFEKEIRISLHNASKSADDTFDLVENNGAITEELTIL